MPQTPEYSPSLHEQPNPDGSFSITLFEKREFLGRLIYYYDQNTQIWCLYDINMYKSCGQGFGKTLVSRFVQRIGANTQVVIAPIYHDDTTYALQSIFPSDASKSDQLFLPEEIAQQLPLGQFMEKSGIHITHGFYFPSESFDDAYAVLYGITKEQSFHSK